MGEFVGACHHSGVGEVAGSGAGQHERGAFRETDAACPGEVAQPDRRSDTVAIGEYERAFTAGQARQIIPSLGRATTPPWGCRGSTPEQI
ncbi:hypothetical protein [Paractinoplanes maris]|uniref:hypothetical protein n=1 Tax=Paractinoplanes maris TaxID=1734446 RepID=UPI0020215506|nr:hypothetical protein [Actinoplanes maris]